MNYSERLELRVSWSTKITILYFSGETQKLRRSFDSIKAGLCSKSIKYNVLFPAKLRVVDGEMIPVFTSPKDAADWLETSLWDDVVTVCLLQFPLPHVGPFLLCHQSSTVYLLCNGSPLCKDFQESADPMLFGFCALLYLAQAMTTRVNYLQV